MCACACECVRVCVCECVRVCVCAFTTDLSSCLLDHLQLALVNLYAPKESIKQFQQNPAGQPRQRDSQRERDRIRVRQRERMEGEQRMKIRVKRVKLVRQEKKLITGV